MYDESPSPLASPLLPKGEASAKGEEKDLGLVLKSSAPGNQDAQTFRWEPGLLPLEGMSDQKNYGVIDAIADELGSSDNRGRQV
ncbi:hypothetical protein [Nostoc sp.]|uniref:hypothetical protein n=1 Tax=Nostoc sp. TaxID=1180 RepID=UPI00359379DE